MKHTDGLIYHELTELILELRRLRSLEVNNGAHRTKDTEFARARRQSEALDTASRILEKLSSMYPRATKTP